MPVKNENLNFGQALELLKVGRPVARKHWNGVKYLFFMGTDTRIPRTGGRTYTNGVNDNVSLLPFIALRTLREEVVPGLLSHSDILAEDWEEIEFPLTSKL